MKIETPLETEISAAIGDYFEVAGIHDVNFKVNGLKGHPFTIGPKHVEFAADHRGGVLTDEVCEKIPCEGAGCHQPRSAHTSDKVLFLKLTADLEKKKASEILSGVTIKGLMIANKIDGFAFIQSGHKFI